MTGPINPLYAMSNIASKGGNDRLVTIATLIFAGVGATMLLKDLKELIRGDSRTRCFDRDEVSRRSR